MSTTSLIKLHDTLAHNTKLVHDLQQQLKDVKGSQTQDWRIGTKEYLLDIRNHIEDLRDRHTQLESSNVRIKSTIRSLNKEIHELTNTRCKLSDTNAPHIPTPTATNEPQSIPITTHKQPDLPQTLPPIHSDKITGRPYKNEVRKFQFFNDKPMANSRHRKRRTKHPLSINQRIENLHIHLREVVKECDAEAPDYYSVIINQIKKVLNEHLGRVRAVHNEWDALRTLKLKMALENNSLRDTIKALEAKQKEYGPSQVLQQGIDAYIQKRTKKKQKSLALAMKQRDESHQQLEAERRAHQASRELVKEYKSKRDSLQTLWSEMQSGDEYNVDSINEEIAAETAKLQEMYNGLKGRNEMEFEPHVSDTIDAICEAISKSGSDAMVQTQLLWKQDVEELSEMYETKWKQTQLKWKQEKNESIKNLDDEYKDVENGNKERLQVLEKECEDLKAQMACDKGRYEMENTIVIFCTIIFYFILISYRCT